MADRIKGITIEINGDTTGLSASLEGLNSKIKETNTALRDVTRLLKLDPGNTDLITQKQKLLAEAIKDTEDKLKQLQEAEKAAQKQLAEGEITEGQYDALKREIESTEQRLKSLEEQAKNSVTALQKIGAAGKAWQEAGEKIESVGQKIAPVSAAVAGIGAAAVKVTADFDAQMAKVSAISGATGEDFDRLRDKAREMGAETKFSASEAAQAFTYMAMAGWDVDQMMDGIAGVMNLAAADGLDLATTSDIVTDAMTALGMTTKETDHFVDILAAASTNANTNVSMMGESFKYAAPLVGSLGYSAEDLAVALGLMANSGIKSSQAGTSMRSALSRLAKPTKQMIGYMDEYDISLTKQDGTMRTLMEVMEMLRDRLGDLDEAEQAEAASAIFGQQAMSGWLAIINASESDFKKLTKAVDECDGTALRMADTMQDTLSGQWTILMSQLQEAAISIGDLLIPKIRELVSWIQNWTDWFNHLDDSQKQMMVNVGLVVAALGPLLVIVGKVVIGMGQLMTAVSTLGPLFAALGAAGGPVLLAAAAVGVLVVAYKDLFDASGDYRGELLRLNEEEQRNKDSVEKAAETYQALNGARQDAVESISAQTGYERDLMDQLSQVVDSEGKVKEGCEKRAQVILGQLSEALGTEIELTDGQIKNYQDIVKALDEVIRKKQAEALLSAYTESYTEAVQHQTDAYMDYKAAADNVKHVEDQLAWAEADLARAKEKLNSVTATGEDAFNAGAKAVRDARAAYADAEAKVEDLRTKLEGSNETLSKAEEVYIGYTTTIQNYSDLQASTISGNQEEIQRAIENATNSFQTAETGTAESLARQVEEFKEKLAAMKQAVEEGAPGITQAQVDEMQRMLDRSREELAKLSDVVDEGMDVAATEIAAQGPKMLDASKAVGNALGDGLVEGADEKIDDVRTEAEKVAGAAEEGMRDRLNTHSPSKVTYEIGADFDEGLAEGIKANAETVTGAVTEVAEAAAGTLNASLTGSAAAAASYQTQTSASWGSWAQNLKLQTQTTFNEILTTTQNGLTAMRTAIQTETEQMRLTWDQKLKAMQERHKQASDDVKQRTTETMHTLNETVKTGLTEMHETVDTELTAMEELTKEKFSEMEKITDEAMQNMLTSVDTHARQLEPTLRQGFEGAVQYLKDLKDQAYVWGGDFMDNFIQAMRERMDDLREACEEAADIVSDYLECSRPDKGAMHTYPIWGKDFMQGYAKSLSDNAWRVTDEMASLTDRMAQTMTAPPDSGKPYVLNTTTQVLLDGDIVAEVVNEHLGVAL